MRERSVVRQRHRIQLGLLLLATVALTIVAGCSVGALAESGLQYALALVLVVPATPALFWFIAQLRRAPRAAASTRIFLTGLWLAMPIAAGIAALSSGQVFAVSAASKYVILPLSLIHI